MATGYWHIGDENTNYVSNEKKYILTSPANYYQNARPGDSMAITDKQILFDFKDIKADIDGNEVNCGWFTGVVPFIWSNDKTLIVGNFENGGFKFRFELGFAVASDDITPANEIFFYAEGK